MDGQYGARTVVMIIPFPTRGRIDLHRADIMVPLGAVFSSYNQQYTARFVARLCGIHAAANSGATGYSGVLQSIRSACSFATRCPNGNPHAARRGRPLVQSLGLFVERSGGRARYDRIVASRGLRGAACTWLAAGSYPVA